MKSRPPFSRLLPALGLLALPVAVVLAGLVAFAGLGAGPAAIAGLAVLLCLAALLRGHLAHLVGLADYAERMAAGPTR